MKTILMTTLVLAAGVTSEAQTTNWKIDHSHSSVKFSVTHMVVSEFDGDFKKFDGKFSTAGDDFTTANVEFTIDVNSINTDNERRDTHLKSDDFFNAAKYPFMKFTGKSLKKTGEKTYILSGDLTIRDVTKQINLNVTYNGTIIDPYKNTRAGFKVTGSIDRFDYNLKWNSMMDTGGAVVGNMVDFQTNIELTKEK